MFPSSFWPPELYVCEKLDGINVNLNGKDSVGFCTYDDINCVTSAAVHITITTNFLHRWFHSIMNVAMMSIISHEEVLRRRMDQSKWYKSFLTAKEVLVDAREMRKQLQVLVWHLFWNLMLLQAMSFKHQGCTLSCSSKNLEEGGDIFNWSSLVIWEA